MKIKTLSVTEVSNYIKRILDNDFILNNLSVRGEVSNLKYHSSGHVYFSMKDNSSRINCVMFKSRAIEQDFQLEEGMEIIASGRVSVYGGNGSLQLYVESIEEEGRGALYKKFEKLKEKLNSKGYFDIENKKPLPAFPRRIGVITSDTGAAIRDIINVTKRRNSMVDLVLYPAAVQGIGAYKQIIEGIKYFNKIKSVDVILIGRGGGSIEELWNFNEEELAVEIFKSKLPIVSAVGHEIDYTISDFVSDLRAATPSQGAEIIVPREDEILKELAAFDEILRRQLNKIITAQKSELDVLKRELELFSPVAKIANSYNLVDSYKEKLNYLMQGKIKVEKERLFGLNNHLQSQNPVSLLNKGFAIVEDKTRLITSIEDLSYEKRINITFKDGRVTGDFKPIK